MAWLSAVPARSFLRKGSQSFPHTYQPTNNPSTYRSHENNFFPRRTYKKKRRVGLQDRFGLKFETEITQARAIARVCAYAQYS